MCIIYFKRLNCTLNCRKNNVYSRLFTQAIVRSRVGWTESAAWVGSPRSWWRNKPRPAATHHTLYPGLKHRQDQVWVTDSSIENQLLMTMIQIMWFSNIIRTSRSLTSNYKGNLGRKLTSLKLENSHHLYLTHKVTIPLNYHNKTHELTQVPIIAKKTSFPKLICSYSVKNI